MSAKNIKKLAIAVALAASASVAQAGFVTVSGPSTSALDTMGIVSANNFRPNLASLGVTSYTLGGSLWVDGPGTVSYLYFGKEAGYQNIFTATGTSGSVTKDSG